MDIAIVVISIVLIVFLLWVIVRLSTKLEHTKMLYETVSNWNQWNEAEVRRLNGIFNNISYNDYLSATSSLLWLKPKKFFDDIETTFVTKEEKEYYDKICTIIDVPYPNEKGFISIYLIGSGYCKLKIKEE